jgi:hypothetical protein
VTQEEAALKEAVERANERAIQIALQRSFEEQYGPGSYNPSLPPHQQIPPNSANRNVSSTDSRSLFSLFSFFSLIVVGSTSLHGF